MQTTRLFVLACLLVSVSCTTSYVSPFGSDQYPGTQTAPFQTIARGIQSQSDTVILMPGAYTGPGNYNIRLQRSVNITAQPNVIVACPSASYSAFYSDSVSSTTPNYVLSGFTIRDCSSGFSERAYSSSYPYLGNLYVKGMTFTHVTQGILVSSAGYFTFNLTVDSSNFTTVNYGILQANGASSYHTIRGSNFRDVSNNAINVPQCVSDLKIMNTNFTGSKDSAILTQCSLNVSNSQFSLLNAVNGSAIFVNSSAVVRISDSVFSNNTALENGGAIVASKGATISIINSKFLFNSALINGGAIYVARSTNVGVGQSILNGNMAGSNGGGAYNEGALNIVSSTFKNNLAKDAGGGFYCFNGLNYVSDSTFTANNAASGPAYGCSGCTTYAVGLQFTGPGNSTTCQSSLLRKIDFP